MTDMALMLPSLLSARDRFHLWETVIGTVQPRAMAEIGVWKGEFAARILSACPSVQSYYMVDPWASLPDWNKPWNVDSVTFADVYAEAMAVTEFAAGRRKVLRGRTTEVVPEIPDDSLDFVYVDGDHTLRGISIDLITMWDKVRPGGLIGGDDLCPSIWQHERNFEPTLIFPFVVYFAEARRAPIYLLDHYQFLIQKPDGPSDFSCIDLTGGRYSERSLRRQLSQI